MAASKSKVPVVKKKLIQDVPLCRNCLKFCCHLLAADDRREQFSDPSPVSASRCVKVIIRAKKCQTVLLFLFTSDGAERML